MQISALLFILLFLIFIIFMVYGAVLMYHWFRYAMSTTIAIYASIAYMGTGFVLLFIMITSVSSLL